MKGVENITKLYDRLTPTERVNLTVAALARGNNAEVGQLVDSCPTKHYIQTDRRYLNPINALYRVKAAYRMQCELYMDKLMILIITGDLSIDCNLDTLLESHIAYLKALYKALCQFCEESSVNLKDMLDWIDYKLIEQIVLNHDLAYIGIDQEVYDSAKVKFISDFGDTG